MSKSLEKFINRMNKKYNKESIINLGSKNKFLDIEMVSTGLYSVDDILGGGLPKGRMIELFGNESSGKTTFAMHLIRQFINQGKSVAFIDTEHAFDREYAKETGIDLSKIWFSQPETAEQAFEFMEGFIENKIDLVIVDSIAAMPPAAEMEGKASDMTVGVMARLLNKECRRIVSRISKKETCLLLINQVRETIGGFSFNNTTTPGGRGIKFASSIRIKIAKKATIKDSNRNAIGIRSIIKTEKNKIVAPFKSAEFDIIFGMGVSIESDMIEKGLELKVIKKNGNSFEFGEEKLGVGRMQALNRLCEDKELVEKVKFEIDNNLNEEDVKENIK